MSRRGLHFMCRNYHKAVSCAVHRRVPSVCYKSPLKCFLTVSAIAVHCQTKEKLNLQGLDKDLLCQDYLLKAAASNTADAVTTLLNRSVIMLILAEQTSIQTIDILIQLLDYHSTILDVKDEASRVWDLISDARIKLQADYKHIRDLEQLHASIKEMVDASAEVAFLAGSEFSSTSLGERLQSSQYHLNQARIKSVQQKAELQEVEDQCASVRAKHESMLEKKKQAEDALFGEDDSTQDSFSSESDDGHLSHDDAAES